MENSLCRSRSFGLLEIEIAGIFSSNSATSNVCAMKSLVRSCPAPSTPSFSSPAVAHRQPIQASHDHDKVEGSLCPNCLKNAMHVFYEVENIPVHSVLLMPTRDRAIDYRRRNLKLAFCPSCGFIGNTIFDPSVHEYSTSCEESQGFSSTFNTFSRGLAKRWVEQYGLQGKTVLEIGCGKGDFLAQMVEEGVARGIGIDPAYVPGRLGDTSRLTFIQDLYDERYSHLQADVICCRHTLEHIAPTHSFMRTLRSIIGDRLETVVLFELPDMQRVLEEAAFWDIYYEHCSYFTRGSLARLFRSTGFELLELGLEYDSQYIVLAARPARRPTELAQPGENDLAAIANAVEDFPQRASELKRHWLASINRRKSAGKKIVIWGGGSKAVSFLTTLDLKDEIDCVVDINPHKHEKFVPGSGHVVKDPAALAQHRPDCIILMNPVYEHEVRGILQQMKLEPEILAV